jgi:hypothetical protein
MSVLKWGGKERIYARDYWMFETPEGMLIRHHS